MLFFIKFSSKMVRLDYIYVLQRSPADPTKDIGSRSDGKIKHTNQFTVYIGAVDNFFLLI